MIFLMKMAKNTFNSGCSEKEIEEAERRLGVSFPAQYKEMLLKFRSGQIGSYEIIGLGKPPAIFNNIIKLKSEVSIPRELLPFHAEEHGAYSCVVASPYKGHSRGSVVFFDPRGDKVKPGNETLNDWFHERVDAVIKELE